MGTPTGFSVPQIAAEDLARRLDREALRQQDTTPPASFQTAHVLESFDFLCELEHAKRTAEEVDRIRNAVDAPLYWELETRCLWDKLFASMLQRHCAAGLSHTDAWKSMRSEVARLMRDQGFSQGELRECRQSIEEQEYWKHEAQHLQRDSVLKEEEIIAAYQAHKQAQNLNTGNALSRISLNTRRVRKRTAKSREHQPRQQRSGTGQSRKTWHTASRKARPSNHKYVVPTESRRSSRIASQSHDVA